MKPGGRETFLWSAIPPLATALFIACYGTNLPLRDEWELGLLLEKLARHQATFADFFQPQAEHRFLLPKLILAPIALATHCNVIVELWLSFAVAVAGFAGLLVLLRRASTGRVILTSLAYFSLGAHENWLWGWQFSWFLTNTLFIWAVVAAGSIRNRPLQIVSAALLCILASFSIAYGIASWIALAPLLWLPVRENEPRAYRGAAMAAWCALFAATLGIYLYGFHPKRAGFPCQSIACWVSYPLTVLGAPLSRTGALALLAGAILVTVFAIAAIRAWRRSDRNALQWVAIGLFAIGFTAMNAIGRSGMGPDQALSSHYLTPASLLLIAVMNLDAFPQRFQRVVFITVFAALVAESLTSIPIGQHFKRTRDESLVCVDLLLVNDSPDCIAVIGASDAIPTHRVGLRPLVTASDFIVAPAASGTVEAMTPLSRTPHPAMAARGRIELPSRSFYVVAATIQGGRRIVAADVVRGRGSTRWSLVLAPQVVSQNRHFEVWLFDPAERKLHKFADLSR